nr:MAG TPA: hypothetical protein [Caudoviricetes sp.]
MVMIKIKVGKSYLTANDNVVNIIVNEKGNKDEYPYIGIIYPVTNEEGIQYYKDNGQCSNPLFNIRIF